MEHFVWDLDPTIFRYGPLQVRYYGILFACVLLGSFYFWQKIMYRRGYPEEQVYSYFYWLALFGILGARIGHCLFYEPTRYLADPIQILYIWKGGLASHGGSLGLMIGAILYAYIKRIPLLVVFDGVAWIAAIASTLVRVGNFFNSEIVGRATNVPWAVHFPRSIEGGALARHPSQLYEAAIGLVIFLALYLIDAKWKDKRPRGLLSAVFMIVYFAARFMVEFVKEYQTLDVSSSALTMGQYLSIPFFLIGWVFLYFAWKDRGRITGEIEPDIYHPEAKIRKNKKKK